MRTLIVTDIHGNLPALQAVLNHPAAQHCERIVSLGDHTGFGPDPRAVHDLLTARGAVLLLGNHEQRLWQPQQYSGLNWRLLHWIAEQMEGIPMRLPTDLRIGPALLTHASPGDPNHAIHEADLPAVLDGLPEGVRCLISGHIHHSWHIRLSGKEAINPGATGSLGDGVGGLAPFLVLETEGDAYTCTRFLADYDPMATWRRFVSSGAAEADPFLTRAAWEAMAYGISEGVAMWIRHTRAAAGDRALTEADLHRASASFAWHTNGSTEAFWKGEFA